MADPSSGGHRDRAASCSGVATSARLVTVSRPPGWHGHDPEDRAHRRADDGEPFLRQQARHAGPRRVRMASPSARTGSRRPPTRTRTATSSTRSGCRPPASCGASRARSGRTAIPSSQTGAIAASSSPAAGLSRWDTGRSTTSRSTTRCAPVPHRRPVLLLAARPDVPQPALPDFRYVARHDQRRRSGFH